MKSTTAEKATAASAPPDNVLPFNRSRRKCESWSLTVCGHDHDDDKVEASPPAGHQSFVTATQMAEIDPDFDAVFKITDYCYRQTPYGVKKAVELNYDTLLTVSHGMAKRLLRVLDLPITTHPAVIIGHRIRLRLEPHWGRSRHKFGFVKPGDN